jgi:hypothetical protein
VKANKATYDLDPRILSVLRARLDHEGPLERTDPDDPRPPASPMGSDDGPALGFHRRAGRIRWCGSPMVDDVLLIAVRRLPLRSMVEPGGLSRDPPALSTTG